MKVVRSLGGPALVALVAIGVTIDHPRAAWTITVAGGGARTGRSDLELARPGGTDLVFREVSWSGESLEAPYYYVLRVTRWSEARPRWGIAFDFTHMKMLGRLHEDVRVSGTRSGSPASGVERLAGEFGRLEFSHGYNLVTLNGVYRGERRGPGAHAVRPYAGLGLGIVLPHVEVSESGNTTDGYQVGGPVAIAMGGADLRLSRHLSVIGEIRISLADLEVDLEREGALQARPWNTHLAIGLSVRIGKCPPRV